MSRRSRARWSAFCAAPGARRRKVSHWDWERKFYKRVRHRDAWIFDLRRGSQPMVLCLGTIAIREDHVTLENLERRAHARVKGVALAAAYQFALAVANVLGLAEVVSVAAGPYWQGLCLVPAWRL